MRTDDLRPRRGRSRCLGGEAGAWGAKPVPERELIAGEPTGVSSEGCGVICSLFVRSKRGRPRPEPDGRVYGMSLQADRGGQRSDVSGNDTFPTYIVKCKMRNGLDRGLVPLPSPVGIFAHSPLGWSEG